MNILLRHLLNWMLSSGTLFLAASAIIPEVSDAAAPSTDTDVSDDAAAEPEAAPETDGAPPVEKPAVSADPKVDGRALPPKVREMMEQLKTADPKAHGFLKDVLFRDRAFRQELPGGLPELKTLKETVAAIGEGGVEALKTERAEWKAIDDSYNAADPRFLDIMVDANPQSFNKMAPLMLGKYAQTDPEGYQRHLAGIFVTSLVNAGVSANLRFLSRAIELGDKEGAFGMLKEVTDFISGLDATAKSQPKVTEKNPELDAREQRLQENEDKQWTNQTAVEINTFKTSAIKKELAQHIKGQQLDDETYEAIEGQALKYLNGILMADPNFMKTFTAYCDSKDRDGVSRYMKSRLEELLPSKNGKPGPVEKAYKLFFRGASSSALKPRTAAGVKPGAPAGPPPKGWEKVEKAPAPHEIDMSKSPFEMRFKQSAVLKTGKRVFWGAQAPA